ncbi:hypothetical protein BJP34_19150 [Moorena producens PAL-8-15-08-1]|uniref:Uncharacterized protein n=1 Tax=Moorena producens PAL-8-15-08-1 TaxID=1458985 RepID=A0A1D8TUE5_9CYAN|nr:hypothetical protein [Moorena producens]AOX01271.1 hypothetical protein BJP34_19150 [Moorena producens PAL-8-15-08-1]
MVERLIGLMLEGLIGLMVECWLFAVNCQPTLLRTPQGNNQITLAFRPRDRVQPSTFNPPTFNLQPANLQPSTFQPSTFNLPTFNLQPWPKATLREQPD